MSFTELFLDRPRPKQPFDGLFAATVAANATASQADVTLKGFDASATYAALFEPRYGSGSDAKVPPVGTKCIVAFTTPIAYVPGKPNVGIGTTLAIVAFLGWPD